MVVVERLEAPVDDFRPILVLCDIDGRSLSIPGRFVRAGFFGLQSGIVPGVDECIAQLLLDGTRRVVTWQDVQGPIGGSENGAIVIRDGGGAAEGKVVRIFVLENGVKTYDGICDVDAVAGTNIFQCEKCSFQPVVFELASLFFFLDNFDMRGVQLVEDGAIADNADAVEDDLLEFGSEGDGYFRGILDAGLIGDIYYIMSVPGFEGQVGLEIEELKIIAITDIVPRGFLIEIGMSGAQPGGNRAGFYVGRGG